VGGESTTGTNSHWILNKGGVPGKLCSQGKNVREPTGKKKNGPWEGGSEKGVTLYLASIGPGLPFEEGEHSGLAGGRWSTERERQPRERILVKKIRF